MGAILALLPAVLFLFALTSSAREEKDPAEAKKEEAAKVYQQAATPHREGKYDEAVKLVVLSACETGVGDVRNGEGVFGLRRALVLAGAQSQLLSLWKVSDAATRKLMLGYYDYLLGGAGRAEALRRIQLEMWRGEQYRHPFFWAAFTFSGDWSPFPEN